VIVVVFWEVIDREDEGGLRSEDDPEEWTAVDPGDELECNPVELWAGKVEVPCFQIRWRESQNVITFQFKLRRAASCKDSSEKSSAWLSPVLSQTDECASSPSMTYYISAPPVLLRTAMNAARSLVGIFSLFLGTPFLISRPIPKALFVHALPARGVAPHKLLFQESRHGSKAYWTRIVMPKALYIITLTGILTAGSCDCFSLPIWIPTLGRTPADNSIGERGCARARPGRPCRRLIVVAGEIPIAVE